MKNKTVENKSTKDKKDSFFKNLVTSIKDFDKYINFVGEGFKKSFIYLVKLIAIFSLIVGIISVYDYSKKLNTIEKVIDEKISNMSYENNIMSINNNEKTEIDTIEDLVGRIIIDTSDLTDEQIENYKEELKSQKKSILLLKDKMILKYQTKQELGEQKYSDLLKNEAVSINKDSLVKYYKDNLANISHQLKTPLTAIMLMIDTLIMEDVDEVKKIEYLKDIRSQIENINFLIIALLKLSRFDANVVVFEKNKIIVKNLIMDVLKNVDILRELNGVSIHTKGKSDVSFIGDYKWECEAITNIVKNAIEYAKDNKDVYIIYEDKNVYNEIRIINDGIITDEDKKNIFKRFYKKNNNGNNFGIGLSLAKEIIEKDKGTIRVECKNNKTIFILKYYK